jgi:2,5-diamino-6-(ribosylamino)-4(3H)-pyrimidinone 5'-phosphate reductase
MKILINCAMSADGKISTRERKQLRISGEEDLRRVDELRSSCDGVMVGIGTVLSDNPSLTVKSPRRRKIRRREGKDENPCRIVVDSNARIPVNAEILTRGRGERIIFVSERAPKGKIRELSRYAEVIISGKRRVDLKRAIRELERRGIRKLMVEGGGELNWSLISNNLVDEIYIYTGNLLVGGKNSPTVMDGEGFAQNESVKLELLEVRRIDDGFLARWKVKVKRDVS